MKLSDALRLQIREFRANFDGAAQIIWSDGQAALVLVTPDCLFDQREGLAGDWSRVTASGLMLFNPKLGKPEPPARPDLSVILGGKFEDPK